MEGVGCAAGCISQNGIRQSGQVLLRRNRLVVLHAVLATDRKLGHSATHIKHFTGQYRVHHTQLVAFVGAFDHRVHPLHQRRIIGQRRIRHRCQERVVEHTAALAMVVTGQRQRNTFTGGEYKAREESLGITVIVGAVTHVPHSGQCATQWARLITEVKVGDTIRRTVGTTQPVDCQLGAVTLERPVTLFETGTTPRVADIVGITFVIKRHKLATQASLRTQGMSIRNIVIAAHTRCVAILNTGVERHVQTTIGQCNRGIRNAGRTGQTRFTGVVAQFSSLTDGVTTPGRVASVGTRRCQIHSRTA